ncbi:MAG: WG repeat-containing protein [Paracoccaceae bacterium]
MRYVSLLTISISAGIAASMSWADGAEIPWSSEILDEPFPISLPAIGHLRVPFSKMDETSAPYPSCYFPGGFCGFVNYQGETVIAPEFDHATLFEGDLSRVSRDGMVGLIDKAGSTVLPIAFDDVSAAHFGAVMARTDELTVLFTLEGERLFETTRDVATLLSDNLVMLGSDRSTHISSTDPYFMAASSLDRQIVNIETGATTNLPDGHTVFYTTDRGMRMVIGGDRKTPAHVYDASGEIIAGPFQRIGNYGNGLFPAQRNNRWGAIDAQGVVIIDFKFVSLQPFYDSDPQDWAVFSRNGKFGYLDTNGVIQIPARFDQARSFASDDSATVTLDGADFEIGRDGERLDRCMSTPLFVRSEDGKYHLLDSEWTRLSDEVYDFVETWCGHPTLVHRDNEYWFLNDDGSKLNDDVYTRAGAFRDGVAFVQVSKTHGTIIDASGRQMLDPVPIRARVITYPPGATINPGPSYVKLNREIAQQIVADPSLLTMPDPHALPDGACRRGVRTLERYRDGRVQQSYYDVNGEPFLSGTFDYAGCFETQTAWVGIPDRQEFCQINREGTIDLSNCDCREPSVIMGAGYDYPDGLSCYESGLWVMRGIQNGQRLPTVSEF